jgi:hypothetical protein
MKLTFKEVDHKYWESNIEEKGYPKFTISTEFKNLYLLPENRPNKREYRLYIWDGENLFDSTSFNRLNEAKNYAKFLHKNP